MPTRICASTSAVLEAIEDGDTPELSGPINLTLPLDDCEIHCLGGIQTFVVRGAPTLRIVGTAETVVSILGPGAPNLTIAGTSRATVTVDLQTPPEGPVPAISIEEGAAPTVTVVHGAPNINVIGVATPTINLLSDSAAVTHVGGGAQPSMMIATSGAFLVELDEGATGAIDVQSATDAGTIRTLGTVTTEINLRGKSYPALDLAGSSQPHVLTWDDAASALTAREYASPAVSTYHRSNLVLDAQDDSAMTVDAHHNSQLMVSGNVTVTPDRSVAVQVNGAGPQVVGICMKQTLQPLGPPILVLPGDP